MARKTSRKDPKTIPLKRPDRSGPDPDQDTLLSIAESRGLLNQDKDSDLPATDNTENGGLDSPGRGAESVLWSISLAMLHFTFDVLVQHQYAEEIRWSVLLMRATQAFLVFFILFYSLHPHTSQSALVPNLPRALHQALFFTSSFVAGCYLIYVTNEHSYYAQMKRSPSIGCLWIWSVIELDLQWALASLIGCAGYLRYGNYSYL